MLLPKPLARAAKANTATRIRTAQRCFSGLDSFALLALPFFSLGGNIMNKGGIARRLVRLARMLVGWVPGYLATTNVLANMFFGAVSGSSVAAASVLAKVSRDRFMREMAAKYPEYRFDRHKGYGTKLHYALLREYGPCPIHRRTFLKGMAP